MGTPGEDVSPLLCGGSGFRDACNTLCETCLYGCPHT